MFERSMLENVPVDSANQLILHARQYQEIEKSFKELLQHLEKAQITVENAPIFKPTKTKYQLVCEIADTRIICQCKYIGAGFVLLFGYIHVDCFCEEKVVIVERRYFNMQGNELEFSKDGRRTTLNAIFEPVFLHKIFYPAVLQALEASWGEFMSEVSE